MPKFSSSLRKNLDGTTCASSPLTNPPTSLVDVRHQDSSRTLPSNRGQTKFKRLFSFRWNNRRTRLAIAPLAEECVPESITKGFRFRDSDTKPDINATSSKSTFATLFLRRQTSYGKDKLHIGSDTTAKRSRCPRRPVGPIPTRSSRGSSCVKAGKPDLLDRHELCSPFTAGIQVSKSPRHMYRPDSRKTRSDDIRSWPILPAPPIIISAPTPPDAFMNENGGRERRLVNSGPKMLSAVRNAEEHSQVPMVIRRLQSAARQLENDATFTQRNMFRLLAPITAFLYALGIGVVMLNKDGAMFGESKLWKSESQVARYVTLFIPLGMLLVLALLRGIILVMSELGRSFCELGLEEVFTRGIFVDSEGERLTEADFIVGNLIT